MIKITKIYIATEQYVHSKMREQKCETMNVVKKGRHKLDLQLHRTSAPACDDSKSNISAPALAPTPTLLSY